MRILCVSLGTRDTCTYIFVFCIFVCAAIIKPVFDFWLPYFTMKVWISPHLPNPATTPNDPKPNELTPNKKHIQLFSYKLSVSMLHMLYLIHSVWNGSRLGRQFTQTTTEIPKLGWHGRVPKAESQSSWESPKGSYHWNGMAESQKAEPQVHGMAWQSPKGWYQPNGMAESKSSHAFPESPSSVGYPPQAAWNARKFYCIECVCILNLYINNMRNHIRSTWAPNCAYSQPALARSLQPTTNQCGYPQTPLQFNHPMVNHGALM
jgi:hypothetical protein